MTRDEEKLKTEGPSPHEGRDERSAVIGQVSPELDRFSQFAVEHLSDATYWMEEDASIIYANEAASRLVGYSVDELRRMKVYELNVDLDNVNWPAIWALLKVERRRIFEAHHRHKDGHVLDVEISANFLELDGKVTAAHSCAISASASCSGSASAKGFLQKPFTLADLDGSIAAALR